MLIFMAFTRECLICFYYVPDMATGQPIENMVFTWDVRTVDNLPLTLNRLADRIRTQDNQMDLHGLKESASFAVIRCLAKRLPSAEEEPVKAKLPHYVSPFAHFTIKPKDGAIYPGKPVIGLD